MGGITAPVTKVPASNASVQDTWHTILRQALRAEASDIHIEPGSNALVIRYRRHGLLAAPISLSARLAVPLTRYLKKLAGLDTRQTRMPQFSNFTVTYGRRSLQLSLATMPLLSGERLVLHVHDPGAEAPSLEALGLWGSGLKQVQYALAEPHGFILISGPNRSGVAVTLASFAETLAHPTQRIASVETNVAYRVQTASYMTVQPQIGMTWERVLRLQLKHEPTVVVLGNTPDRATAELALGAARHDQLVMSGLPADDNVAAVRQLTQLCGDFLSVAVVLRLVTNQRLVWHLCPDCRQAYKPDAALQAQLAKYMQLDRPTNMRRVHELELRAISEQLGGNRLSESSSSEQNITQLWRPKPNGCRTCHGSGYSGAIALFSVLPISDRMSSLIARGASAAELRTTVRNESVSSLRVDALIKALRGLVDISVLFSLP